MNSITRILFVSGLITGLLSSCQNAMQAQAHGEANSWTQVLEEGTCDQNKLHYPIHLCFPAT